ncbi:MAG TPA: hypothetical protein VFT95_03020, partial [Micromonosporaceae bacterium]|nr:hypothetical protein [Micromonosporaceae bacterium]
MTVAGGGPDPEPPRPGWRRAVETVLPPAPPLPDRRPAYVGAFLVAVFLGLFLPAARTHLNHVWAEDGARFTVDALGASLWSNLATPYGGYLHTVPRLLIEPLSLLPLTALPAAIAVVTAILRAGIALLVFAASGAYLRWLPVRTAHAALVVLLPAGNSEALGNLANLHWFLLYGAFWALLWRPAARGANILAAVVVTLAVLSDPLVLLLVPLVLLRLLLPSWPDRFSAIGFGAGAVLQIVAMLGAPRAPSSDVPVDPVRLLLAGILRDPVVTFAGPEVTQYLYPRFGNAVLLVAILLALVPIAAAVLAGDRPHRFLALVAAGYSALIMVLVMVVNWTPELQERPAIVLFSQRYSVAPALFLCSAIAAGLDRLPE